ncbi:MAG: hypothetical protein Q9191_005735 [Dirinaria sp. TL-2023a]
MAQEQLSSLLTSIPELSSYETLYKHFHSHPELSVQEYETANTVAEHLRDLNAYHVQTNIGGTGVVGVLENGPGKVILLRADMDALPVKEETGLDYASTVTVKDESDGDIKPVMHACGHDMHMTCLLATAEHMVKIKDRWNGTLIILFQPNEERGGGARAMVDDGLYDKVPVPDYVLGQHVMANRAGTVGSKVGTIMASSDRFKITLFGKGGHGSMPHRTIDPAVLAASVVLRLQTIVSREVDPNDMAVVTVASLQVGQTENIITDKAVIKVDVRTVNAATRERVLAAVRRIVKAECYASGSPKEPLIEQITAFPLTVNDEALANTVAASFQDHLHSFEPDTERSHASDDVTILATSKDRPSLYWFLGGVDHQQWDQAEKDGTTHQNIPVNHSPFYAPVIQPTMKVGIEALSLAALTMFSQTS